MLVIHGPTVQHELELWVKANIPASVALQAATYNAAKVLHAENRFGLIREGMDANILVLDGDPLKTSPPPSTSTPSIYVASILIGATYSTSSNRRSPNLS